MIAILSHIPLWVWAVFIYGLAMGVNSLRPRQVLLAMTSLMPLVFFGLGLTSLVSVAERAPAVAVLYGLALATGGVLGWFFLFQKPLAVDRHRQRVTLPGTWTVLALFLVIFSTKFVYGTLVVVRPDLAAEAPVLALVFGLAGISTGIVTGKAARLYSWYFAKSLVIGD